MKRREVAIQPSEAGGGSLQLGKIHRVGDFQAGHRGTFPSMEDVEYTIYNKCKVRSRKRKRNR